MKMKQLNEIVNAARNECFEWINEANFISLHNID